MTVRGLAPGRWRVAWIHDVLQAYDADRPHFHVMENGTPHARYVICERGPDGWSVTFRCVAYDHAKAAATAKRNGRDDWARWLETGRV